jgi:hypothetical protein
MFGLWILFCKSNFLQYQMLFMTVDSLNGHIKLHSLFLCWLNLMFEKNTCDCNSGRVQFFLCLLSCSIEIYYNSVCKLNIIMHENYIASDCHMSIARLMFLTFSNKCYSFTDFF